MADDQDEANPIEQLLELMVYAPIGLLYEYQDVLPKLVKRGKSQVQLARLFGQMAAKRNQSEAGGIDLASVASLASSAVARALTDIGAQLGLAPTSPASGGDSAEAKAEAPAPSVDETDNDGREATDSTSPSSTLPVAGYDELKAREIIPMLEDLSESQRDRIQTHEAANRNRKTVLAKLDRLRS